MEQVLDVSAGVTTWVVWASDGTPYASIALLQAAGKVVFPDFPPGIKSGHLVLVSHATGAVTLGAGFNFRTNLAVAPTFGTLVLAGVTYSYPGVSQVEKIIIDSVWTKQSVAGDYINMTCIY